ncbi:MBOAT family O-acyltransferase [Tamlana sp. 2201CG12-4]|uniref:MBOAT family O-acyltransferase n=1 Tax=Tamlana sp. 2201CG12-4 TaxID=3112582 RepID=UPI002DBFFD5A|nr:MBOAT family O-acyltransferase [Tamlana sp. 2201CG12-4]MEC3908034.1 MBOAT family O-acyltransferase [Tamlana sp. 2201CG12-4]
MLFNSFEFLLFFPIMVIGFYILNYKYRWLWLLLGSYYFYMAHEPELIILLIISTLVDYYCGIRMYEAKRKSAKKGYLILSIVTNVGLLIVFKYLFFFSTNIQWFFDFFGVELIKEQDVNSYNFNNILLPIGISFYTFQTMSYSIEIYRGLIKPERHIGKFALYVSFFPQLVAGPVERASRLLPQLKSDIKIEVNNLKQGIIMMAWGFFLKLVVADRLGIYVDEAFRTPDSPHNLSLILGSFFFCFQIYYDFSAYTSIAIGAAKTMGYELIQNFNQPIFATSFTEFWKRWHISFTQWLKDFIYKPLVKNGRISRLFAVFIVFFINGLWHGANWTFVVWSLLNAFLLVLEISTKSVRYSIFNILRLPKRVRELLGWCTGLSLITMTLVFFRSPNLSHATLYLKNMFTFKNSLHINILDNYFELFLSFILILIVQTIYYYKGNSHVYELFTERPKLVKYSMCLVYILTIVLFAINRQNSFIYFQF